MLVVDANVIVKLFIDEPDSGRAARLLTDGRPLLVPAHGFAETGEVISRKIKSGFVDENQLSRVLHALESRFTIVPLLQLLPQAITLSVQTGASVYDCLYVVLAASEDCRLVTPIAG